MYNNDELTKSILELVKNGKMEKELAFSILKELKQGPNRDENNSALVKQDLIANTVLKRAPGEDEPERVIRNERKHETPEGAKFENLLEYLTEVVSLYINPLTVSGDKVNWLIRWLVKRVEVDHEKYERFEPNIDLKSELLSDMEFQIRDKYVDNWQYYVAKDIKSEINPDPCRNYPYLVFQDNPDRDYCIYALCGVYCEKEQDVIFHIDTITSVRIWVNGRIAFANSYRYHVKTQFFIFRLKKGNNIILVEKPYFVKGRGLNIPFDFFSINIKPYSFIKKRKYKDFINTSLMKELEEQYAVIPDKAFFNLNEATGIIVLPKRFNQGKSELVTVEVFNTKGESIINVKASTSEKILLNINEAGVFKIIVNSLLKPKKTSFVYLFRGDFPEYVAGLIDRGKNTSNISEHIITAMEGIKGLPDCDTGCFKGFPELVNAFYYNLIFGQCVEFEKILESGAGECAKPVKICGACNLLYEASPIDNEPLVYTVHFPKQYNPHKKYPLAIYMSYGYANSKYPIIPDFIQRQDFTEAIIVTICGRGDIPFDYINDFSILRLIDKLREELNIDRDRLYTMGICIGGSKGVWMGIRHPHLWAAMTSVTGIVWLNLRKPHFRLLQNVNNTCLYQLSNLDDIMYNSNGFTYLPAGSKNIKYKIFESFAHIDFEEFFLSRKMLVKTIKEKKVKYPRKLQFYTFEPPYNKSFWIEVNYIKDLTKLASVSGEVKSHDVICLNTDNIERLTLLLAGKEMKLGKNVNIYINSLKEVIHIKEYAKVSVLLDRSALKITVKDITKDMFEKEYNTIVPREELLGIRQVYLQKCVIIKPDYLGKKLFEKRLTAILQKPFKTTIRNYKYDLYSENQINPEILSQSNFIYIIDARLINEFEAAILENKDFRVKASEIIYQNVSYGGDYFALLSVTNPFNSNSKALFIVYNNETVQEELIDFCNSLQLNSLFYNKSVIYSHGNYYGFRDSIQ